jgi:ABC-type nitrate/sulfonate/bicarbonate transport system permease component
MATLEEVKVSARPSGLPGVQARLGQRLTGVISLMAFLAIWQLVVVITEINPILLPSPGSVVEQLVEAVQLGLFWPAVTSSLKALVVGLVLALVVGVVVGLVIGASSWLDLVTGPYLWASFATPRIALAPLIVLWLGVGLSAKVWLVFLSALLPVILSCKEGVQTVDESLVRAARSFGAGRVALFRHVVIPFTLPFIANGIRNGIARGFVGLLIIEMTVGTGGIGTQVMKSMRGFNTARMFAFVAVLVIAALTLISLSRKLEARASRWREEIYV